VRQLIVPVLIVVCGMGVFLAVIFTLPPLVITAREVPEASKRVELQNAVRTTLVQGMGGLLLIAGAYFTWQQLQLGRLQLRQSLDTSTAQIQLSREGQITDQFSRAVEQLGHERPSVRVGAIYALEQIAHMSERMRAPIHELLAAYVRAESVWAHHDPETFTAVETDFPGDSELPLLKVRAPDVQAAITILGRRTELPGEVIELQSVDLRSAYLGDSNFRRAIFGRSILAQSDLSRADLSDAWLRRANLRDAVLAGARLRGAVLRNAVLCGTDLSEADLSGADLRDAKCNEATIWPAGFDWEVAGVMFEGSQST
jgi:hypothetical protein